MKPTDRLDQSAPEIQIPAEAGSLIPLARALELIAAEVYEAEAPLVSRTALFDALACTLSVLSPMFAFDAEPPRQLSEEELGKAGFRSGGTEMYFCDGRSPLREIAVTPDGIRKVIRVLKDSTLER